MLRQPETKVRVLEGPCHHPDLVHDSHLSANFKMTHNDIMTLKLKASHVLPTGYFTRAIRLRAISELEVAEILIKHSMYLPYKAKSPTFCLVQASQLALSYVLSSQRGVSHT